MLNKSERFKVLEFIRVSFKLGLLPLEINLMNWQVRSPSTRKQCNCFLSYCGFLLHIMYKFGSLVYTYLFVPDVLHVIMAMGVLMTAYWYHIGYVG